MSKRPLKATDKRRAGMSDNVRVKVYGDDDDGLSDIFNDRRFDNGKGHSRSNGKGKKGS